MSNFGPLTTSADGGPYLHNPPGTAGYTVEYDSSGHVWVAPPDTFENAYEPAQDFDVNPSACEQAVTP